MDKFGPLIDVDNSGLSKLPRKKGRVVVACFPLPTWKEKEK